ncbi:MAG: PQQ-binding-like beta-propeller repeat protein [Acidobacteriota bacterium]
MKVAFLLLCLTCALVSSVPAQAAWQTDLGSRIRFYQTTDLGIILAGTERSVFAIDDQTGERMWRVDTGKLNETAVTPIPGPDVVLMSRDLGGKSRLDAIDVLTGKRIWQSDKVRGDVMQLAVDPTNDLIALVLVKDARADAGSTLKRKPVIHVLELSTGNELWKRDLEDTIQMMPARFGSDDGDVDFTLDNYRAPLLLDGRLMLFYDGATSYDARTGKEKERDKFKINESGLALTDADPVYDSEHVFVSGRGRIRAINRKTGDVDWKADDLGTCAEMANIGGILYVRTGGQFTRLKDGEAESKGPYGISAIDTRTGKTRWRYKGADKGLTNFVFADAATIVIADRDDLITLDAATGKARSKLAHKIDKAQFVLVNENAQAIVGGQEEIAAFRTDENKGAEIWRVRHKAPARGAIRIVAGVALRAAAIYFRYGGLATSAIGLARSGIGLAGTINSFRVSGLQSRYGSFDLTTLASSVGRDYMSQQIYAYGSLARMPRLATPGSIDLRGTIVQRGADRAILSSEEVHDSIFEQADPVRLAERFSDYLLRRKRVAALRSNYMYFYTDLPRPMDKKGLVGVNIHTGRDSRYALVSEPDPQFVTDEVSGLLYSANGTKIQAFEIVNR